LPADQVATQHHELKALACRVGKWALLLKLVNGFLLHALELGQALPLALAGVNKRLDEKRLTAFDPRKKG
jgi:hypothetical protein